MEDKEFNKNFNKAIDAIVGMLEITQVQLKETAEIEFIKEDDLGTTIFANIFMNYELLKKWLIKKKKNDEKNIKNPR